VAGGWVAGGCVAGGAGGWVTGGWVTGGWVTGDGGGWVAGGAVTRESNAVTAVDGVSCPPAVGTSLGLVVAAAVAADATTANAAMATHSPARLCRFAAPVGRGMWTVWGERAWVA